MSQRTRILADFAHQMRDTLTVMANGMEVVRLTSSPKAEESIRIVERCIGVMRELVDVVEEGSLEQPSARPSTVEDSRARLTRSKQGALEQ